MTPSIIVERDRILPAIQRAAKLIRGRHAIPILNNIRLTADQGRLRVIGCNLDCEIETVVPADVGEAKDITVPAHRFLSLISGLSAGAQISLRCGASQRDNWSSAVEIAADRMRTMMPILPGSDFPVLQPDASATGFVVAAAALRLGIDFCRDAICKTPDRPHFHGLRIEGSGGKLSAFGYNGTDCASIDLPVVEPPMSAIDATIPTFAADLIRSALPEDGDIAVAIGERLAAVQVGDTTIKTKLVEVEWPDWRQLLVEEPEYTIVAEAQPLLNAFGRLIAATNGAAAHLDIGRDRIALFARGASDGSAHGIEFTDEIYAECDIVTSSGALPGKLVAAIEALLKADPKAERIEIRGFRGAVKALRFYLPGRDDCLRMSMPAAVRGPVTKPVAEAA